MTKEQMTALWNAPGVAEPGHLTIWEKDKPGVHKPGTARNRVQWDKELLKRAKKELPNWYSWRLKSYY